MFTTITGYDQIKPLNFPQLIATPDQCKILETMLPHIQGSICVYLIHRRHESQITKQQYSDLTSKIKKSLGIDCMLEQYLVRHNPYFQFDFVHTDIGEIRRMIRVEWINRILAESRQ